MCFCCSILFLVGQPHRILPWVKEKMYSGSTHGLTSLTKSIHAVELRPGFVEDLRTHFLPPQRAMLIREVTTRTLWNGSSKQWKYVPRITIRLTPTHERTNQRTGHWYIDICSRKKTRCAVYRLHRTCTRSLSHSI